MRDPLVHQFEAELERRQSERISIREEVIAKAIELGAHPELCDLCEAWEIVVNALDVAEATHEEIKQIQRWMDEKC